MKLVDSFFYHIGKYIFIVPLIIIVASLFFTYQKKSFQSSTQLVLTNIPVQNVNEIQTASALTQNAQTQIDLIGPWVCDHTDANASMSAFIKNKQVYATYTTKEKTQTFLVMNDCFYQWTKGDKKGQIMCSVNQYLDLASTLLQSGMMSSQMQGMMSTVLGPSVPSFSIDQLSEYCVKKDFSTNVFHIPPQILFQKK